MTTIWQFRSFIFSSVRTEYAIKFSRSKIGAMWMIIYPLAQVAIFTLVMSKIIGTRLTVLDSPYGYPIYLMAGQLAWTGFSDTVSRLLIVFINQGQLLKKANFPIIAFPIVEFIVGLLNAMIFLFVIITIFAFLGHAPDFISLLAVPLILLTLLLATATGMIVGTLNVFVRGVGQLVPILLNFGFWLAPIVYLPDLLPEWTRSLLSWNPMYHIVIAFHDVMVFHRLPVWQPLLAVLVLTTALFILALHMTRKAGPEMADVL